MVQTQDLKDFSAQAYDVFKSVFKANKVPKILDTLTVTWSNRLTVCAGRAYFYRNEIVLSSKLFNAATPKERDEIAAHEASHLVAFNKDSEMYHGPSFNEAMKNAGYEPFVFHNIRYGVEVTCGCSNFIISHVRATRLKNGTKYCCLKCNKNVELAVIA